ncbi:MAG: hypothetical protein LLG06_02635 [Desulfobacteraceae bacterium]|nr:hypothetical protein [Desulfobacteraceae bacterium]
MFSKKTALMSTLFLLVTALAVGPCFAAAPAPAGKDEPVKIAILPFTMHTPQNLNYLQSGIRDMLASRLAWQGKVQIIGKTETEQAARGTKEIGQNEAVRLGGSLKADYVLFGSITGLGQTISIDAKMVPVALQTDPVSFFTQTKNLDEVLPQINNFAQDINSKVFGKASDKSQSASSEAEMLATKNPEFLLPGAFNAGDKISYLNPNFIEVTPESQLRQPGVWRSQTFQGGILGMDAGDLDGDGKAEIVTILKDKVVVYKKEMQGLKVIASFQTGPMDRFIWVCVADLNRDGHAYIFLTNMRNHNAARSQPDKKTDLLGTGEEIWSYVLSLSGNKLQVVAERVHYFLNTVSIGLREKVLVGQQQGDKTESAFTGGVMMMQLKGNSLTPVAPVNLPAECNVFNFAKADVKNDHTENVIMLDQSHNLRLLNAAGDQIWKGNQIFGATTNVFEARVEDRRYNMVDLFAIPSPILVTDLNKDGIVEIVVNRNTTNFDKFLPETMKYYDRGEIISLSWDNLSLLENWKTRELNGQVTSIRIADLHGDGKQQLILSVVAARDLLKIWDSKSYIVTYDLSTGANAKSAASASTAEKPAPRPVPADKTDSPKSKKK